MVVDWMFIFDLLSANDWMTRFRSIAWNIAKRNSLNWIDPN